MKSKPTAVINAAKKKSQPSTCTMLGFVECAMFLYRLLSFVIIPPL
jgi:hypothetical protein